MQSLASFLMVYFFPLQLFVGLVGNVLNLIVLLNRRIRSRTNIFLAAVAFADIFFLFLMVPFTIKYNAFLRQIKVLNLFMQYSNLHITGLINMCAFASTWFLVTVCFERLLAVRWPLKARTFWSNRARPSRIICLVWLVAFLVTMYCHITHTVTSVFINESSLAAANSSNSQKPARYVLRTQLRPYLFHYWRIATILHTVLQVFVPVVLVALTSYLTADALFSMCSLQVWCKGIPMWWTGRPKKNSKVDANARKYQLHSLITVSLPPNCPSLACNESHSSSHTANHSPANQKRATVVVLIIASTFAVFQLPSAIVYIWELVRPEAPMEKAFITAATLANSLVVTGKMTNFFLFCMSSRNFRRNLQRIMCKAKKSAKSSFSGAGANGYSNSLHQQPLHRHRPDSSPNSVSHYAVHLVATVNQHNGSRSRRNSDQIVSIATKCLNRN